MLMGHMISIDEYISVGTHWIAFYVNGNKTIYFVSFRDEHVSKEVKSKLSIKYYNKHLHNPSI